jgi:probable HAF family extracellular repeat protein
MPDLGSLGGTGSFANAINNHGQIVGGSQTASGFFVWEGGGVLTNLKTLGGYTSNRDAINDARQIVGSSKYQHASTEGPRQAFLWQNGKMTDLNKQLARLGLGSRIRAGHQQDRADRGPWQHRRTGPRLPDGARGHAAGRRRGRRRRGGRPQPVPCVCSPRRAAEKKPMIQP